MDSGLGYWVGRVSSIIPNLRTLDFSLNEWKVCIWWCLPVGWLSVAWLGSFCTKQRGGFQVCFLLTFQVESCQYLHPLASAMQGIRCPAGAEELAPGWQGLQMLLNEGSREQTDTLKWSNPLVFESIHGGLSNLIFLAPRNIVLSHDGKAEIEHYWTS